jgi:uncharacterized membrane protein YuzA (DUF378 family)
VAKVHIHGCISVLFVIAAMMIGFIAILKFSLLFAVCFATLTIIAYCVIAAVYCSKCNCRDTCNHLFVGMLSKAISRPNNKPYTKSDMFYGAALPIGITVILPQFWLLKSPSLLLSFWGLLLIGATEIILFVCKGCRNRKCSMCR